MILRLSIDAFTARPETQAALAGLGEHRELSRCRVAIRPGGFPAAISHYGDTPPSQVIIVEEDDPDHLFDSLERLAEVCDPDTRVMVIGATNDIGLYRKLVALGVGEYLPRPVSADQIVETLRGMFSDAKAAPRGKTIAWWGVRGGVGTSSLAQNSAWALAQHLREPVVYIDLDLAFGTSLLAFNLEAKQTVADALTNPERLDEVLLERYLVEYDDHLRILASAGDCRPDAQPTLDGIERLIDLAQRLAGVVVLDLPHLWCDWTRQALAQADEVVLVANPDIFCLRDGKTATEACGALRGISAPHPRLVLNKTDAARRTQLTAKDFQETADLAVAASFPYEPLLFGDAANNGQMLGEAAKSHKLTLALAQFATSLAGKAPAAAKPAASALTGVLQWLRK